MSSGVNRVRVGAFTGTGSALNVRTVGFRPKVVEIYNVSSDDEMKWIEGMADASGIKRVKAGGASLVTSGGVTPLSDGFTLGTDSDLNASGELCRFVAYE